MSIATKLEQDGLVITDQVMGKERQNDAAARAEIEIGEQRIDMGRRWKDAMTRESRRQHARRIGPQTGGMNPPSHRPE